MVRLRVALVFLLLVELAKCQSCADPDADVLILGAGIAGIAAAKRLNEEGLSNFIILEALDRMGGRMRQGEIGGVKIELGANWIHDIDPMHPELHPLWELAQKCGGLQGNYSQMVSPTVYDEQGNDISDSDLLRYDDYYEGFEGALEIGENRERDNMPDISVREGLTLASWTPSTPEDDWVEWFHFDFNFAEPPEDTSLFRATSEYFGMNSSQIMDYFVQDSDGYAKIVRCLASDFLRGDQDERLHLNTIVAEIQWSDDCVCAVAFENGGDNRYCAPYAIMTFSLGVLQSEALNMRFMPELPVSKLEVIEQISMAHYLKIFFKFNETFWDSNVDYIGHVSSMHGYFPLFQPLPDNVLLATVVGELADRIVQQPEEETKTELMQVIRNIYGPTVPDPIDVVIPDWKIDLFLGTYSNSPVGVTDETHRQLAAPVGRLYFSGEATSANYHGFVHGGLFSGYDSADAVIGSRSGCRSNSISGNTWTANVVLLLILCLSHL